MNQEGEVYEHLAPRDAAIAGSAQTGGMRSEPAMTASPQLQRPPLTASSARRIVLRTRGRQHGPIVRLISPSDLGELIKPFVFLDHIDFETTDNISFDFHPHSGIATLTLLLEGGFAYEDSIGEQGVMSQGSVEWMQAGGGVWHRGNSIGKHIKGYQLWVALPPDLESSSAASMYLEANRFHRHGPARVILGEWGGVRSPIPPPSPMNCLEVNLRGSEVWRYEPPPGHDVAWIAVHDGTVTTPEIVTAGELVVFAPGQLPIDFQAKGHADFVLGSAVRHPHELVLGHYSVHTHAGALARGEATIRRIGGDLRRGGKLPA